MQIHTSLTQPILVGLALNGRDAGLLQTARALARKLHAPLELLHAVKPIFNYVGAGDVVLNPYYEYENAFSENEEREARSKLQQLADSIDDVQSVSVTIVRDYAAEGLLAHAEEIGAGLIICGVNPSEEDKSGLLSTQANAFNLAGSSDVPVLMVPVRSEAFDLRFPLRLVVADNLEDEGQAALEAGISLANALHAEQLIHFHAWQTSAAEVDRMVESVQNAMLKGELPPNPRFTRDYYIERMQERGMGELRRRAESIEGAHLQSTQYEPRLGFGDPASELQGVMAGSGAQIAIFGRHHILHRRTLSLGRIPYRSMIEQGAATLVVPDTKPSRAFLKAEVDYRGDATQEGGSAL